MTVKATGAEIQAFMKSDWDDGFWMDDYIFEVNGEEVGSEFEEEELNPDDKVKIIRGEIYDEEMSLVCSLESYFKKWRKKQAETVLVVSAPNDKLEAIKIAIAEAGGKILK